MLVSYSMSYGGRYVEVKVDDRGEDRVILPYSMSYGSHVQVWGRCLRKKICLFHPACARRCRFRTRPRRISRGGYTVWRGRAGMSRVRRTSSSRWVHDRSCIYSMAERPGRLVRDVLVGLELPAGHRPHTVYPRYDRLPLSRRTHFMQMSIASPQRCRQEDGQSSGSFR